jgi:serine O-acetyltransferase
MSGGIKVSTSQASVFERHQFYASVLARFERVLYLCVGSVFTGNCAVAMEWKKEHDPENRLTVIDTGAASGRLGVMVLATQRYLLQTGDMDKTIAFARDAVARSEEYVFLEKLQYLAAGGRLSKTSAFFGDMLKMKPVISPQPEGAKKVGVVRNRAEQIKMAYDRLAAALTPDDAALIMLEAVSELRGLLAGDVRAAFEGDPAATCHDEIIFSYPGIYAMSVYRVAHKLYDLQVPLLPRIMTEHAHSVTGIDIHPGAVIGERFVIDHGTGVVIGETARIGRNVRVYQGVTLGALSLPKDAGDRLRGKKRHPAIEDDVIIYSGATILGGDTVIGARSVIGGNVWITESVPPDTTVLMEPPRLIYK